MQARAVCLDPLLCCRPGQASVVGGQAGMTKHAPFIRMHSYYIVRIIPALNIWYFVMGIDYNSSTSIKQHIHDIVHRSFYLQHFRHYYCCNNCYPINSSIQCMATGQAPITLYSSSSFQYERNALRLLYETNARSAQVRDVTRTYTFGCSDTVMVSI